MKSLSEKINEGFYKTVAPLYMNQAVDLIKEISEKDRCYDEAHAATYTHKLTDILKQIERELTKGRFALTYTRNDGTCTNKKVKVTLTMFRANDPRWQYESGGYMHGWDAKNMAQSIVGNDLYYEAKYPTRDSKLRHNIAKTIEIQKYEEYSR